MGKAVLGAMARGQSLTDIDLAQYREWCPVFDADLYAAIELKTCVDKRMAAGGPARAATMAAVAAVRAWLEKER